MNILIGECRGTTIDEKDKGNGLTDDSAQWKQDRECCGDLVRQLDVV